MSEIHALEAAVDPEAHPRRWVILGVLCTSLLLVMQGNTALNLALPKIAGDIGLSQSAMQWVVDAYSLVFAGLLFTTSTIGDRFGRKGVMQAGLVLFGLATGFAAFGAHSAGALIGARAVMGLAGAMIMPSTLSILINVFPASERPKAIAVWSGIAGGGAALGMLLNGFVLEHFSWHVVFVINIPLALGALAVGALIVPTSKDPNGGRVDLLGAVLSTAGIASLVYALIEAPAHGWLAGSTLAYLGAGLLALGGFVAWQLRTSEPMLDVRLFRKPAFGVSSLTLTLVFFALMGIFFSISQLFQLVMGYGNRAQVPQDVSAVVGANLLVRRAAFDDIGGLDTSFPVAYNDVDFCLKLRRAGWRILYVPDGVLLHEVSASFETHQLGREAGHDSDATRMADRWGDALLDDPAHNPNLALDASYPSRLASPPRLEYPWRRSPAVRRNVA
jgi:MFS family permease